MNFEKFTFGVSIIWALAALFFFLADIPVGAIFFGLISLVFLYLSTREGK